MSDNNKKEMYKKTSHFANMLDNTKDIETHKYTEEQYNADLHFFSFQMPILFGLIK